jgi:hypothetical protein
MCNWGRNIASFAHFQAASRTVPTRFGAIRDKKGHEMGGFGSGRWGWHWKKTDTDPLPRLDVRDLARRGKLTPGVWSSVHWTRGGKPAGSIAVVAEPNAVILDYKSKGPMETEWKSIHERISLTFTPCTYGGERPWFVCPSCWSRRAVLYLVGDCFRCRSCHDLAYSSTRERPGDRAQRRANTLRQRLGDASGSRYQGLLYPEKPKGMHWRTYERLHREMMMKEYDALAFFVADTDKMCASIDRSLARSQSKRS